MYPFHSHPFLVLKQVMINVANFVDYLQYCEYRYNLVTNMLYGYHALPNLYINGISDK